MKRSLCTAFSLLMVALATAALVVLPSGCNPIGCFEASEAGGSCPDQEEALPFFGDPTCGGRVASVNSPPTVSNDESGEGTLCCYAITNQDPDYAGCPDF